MVEHGGKNNKTFNQKKFTVLYATIYNVETMPCVFFQK